jgi:hypothetical protein
VAFVNPGVTVAKVDVGMGGLAMVTPAFVIAKANIATLSACCPTILWATTLMLAIDTIDRV